MVRSRAAAVTLPGTVSPLRRIHSLSRRASRAATMASSYLLVPGGGINDDSLVMPWSPLFSASSESGRAAHPPDARSLRVHDRREPADRALEIVVQYRVIVLGELLELAFSLLEPALDHVRRVGAASGEPFAQRFHRGQRRIDEHRHRVSV